MKPTARRIKALVAAAVLSATVIASSAPATAAPPAKAEVQSTSTTRGGVSWL